MQTDATQAQEKSILGLINEILLKKEFICPELNPVAENEVVIGVLSDEEKAIIRVTQMIEIRHNQALSEHSQDELDNNQLHLNKLVHEALYALLWANIKARIGKAAIEPRILALKQDWQVVTMSKEDEEIAIDLIADHLAEELE